MPLPTGVAGRSPHIRRIALLLASTALALTMDFVSARAADLSVDGMMVIFSGEGDDGSYDNAFVGRNGIGQVIVENGADVTSDNTYLGENAGSQGTLTVTGGGSTWNVDTHLTIGALGEGSMTVTDGASATITGFIDVGSTAGGSGLLVVSDGGSVEMSDALMVASAAGTTGTVWVTGAGSTLETSRGMNLGTFGDGFLTVADGGSISGGDLDIGWFTGSSGTALLTGAGSTWTSTGTVVGNEGSGSLTVADGAIMNVGAGSGTITIAGQTGSNGVLNIGAAAGDMAEAAGTVNAGTIAFGAGSGTLVFNHTDTDYEFAADITGTGAIDVYAGETTLTGQSSIVGDTTVYGGWLKVGGETASFATTTLHTEGTGNFQILDGASVQSDYVYLGEDIGSSTILNVVGTGSSLTVADTFYAGYRGTTMLALTDGASIQSFDAVLGSTIGSQGYAFISGAGSSLTADRYLFIGDNGGGQLVVANGATVDSLYAFVGYEVASNAAVTVAGDGSTWNFGDFIYVGVGGNGSLTIADDALVTADGGSGTLYLANNSGSTGTLNIGAAAGEDAVAAGTLNAGVVDFGTGTGTLVFNHTDANYIFSADITGSGAIDVYSGTTKLTGDLSGFTGTTEVYGGILSVNSTYSSAISVMAGGTLGGSGTLSAVTLFSGATIAPGNSIGTLTVAGNLDLVSGTTYAVEVDDGGTVAGTNNDLLHVTGAVTIDSGAAVTVTPVNGTDNGLSYVSGSVYRILTAGSGVSGTFGTVTDSFAFLDSALSYDASNVYLTLARNSTDFASLATTPNQKATADAIEGLGSGTLYDAVAGLGESDVPDAFQQLSGELHANVNSTLLSRSGFSRDTVNNRIRDAFDDAGTRYSGIAAYGEDGLDDLAAILERSEVWASGFGSWTSLEGDGNALGASTRGGGMLYGLDRPLGDGWRLGAVAGYGQDSVTSNDTDASGTVDSYYLGLYGGRSLGPVQLRFGALHAFQEIDSKRRVAFTGFTDDLTADYHGGTSQAFVEGAWRFDRDLLHVEPFANIAYVHSHTDAFTETGGAAALSKAANDENQLVSTLGFRLERDIAWQGMLGKLSGGLGWRHTFGDLSSEGTYAFAGSDSFTVASAVDDRDTAFVNLGLSFDLSETATLAVSYSGQFGDKTVDHQASTRLGVAF